MSGGGEPSKVRMVIDQLRQKSAAPAALSAEGEQLLSELGLGRQEAAVVRRCVLTIDRLHEEYQARIRRQVDSINGLLEKLRTAERALLNAEEELAKRSARIKELEELPQVELIDRKGPIF